MRIEHESSYAGDTFKAPSWAKIRRVASNSSIVSIGSALVIGAVLGAFGVAQIDTWIEPDVARYREIRDYTRAAFVREVTDEQLLGYALHGLADGLDDYSQYYDPEEAAQLDRETTGRYNGLGIVIQRPFSEGRILFPLANSPARRAGVRVGDRMLRIAGKAFSEIDEPEFRRLISSVEPRDVELVLEGLDHVDRTVTARTGSVVEPTVKHERILDAERGIGYVAITSFSHETASEFADAVERLQEDGMRALVLDLRQNPGGVLVAAVEVAKRFVKEGLIVSTEGRGAPVLHSAVPGATQFAGLPLVVLVDEGSASASEVLASALQEHRAAVLVGGPTYGKGMVQSIHRFADDGSVMKVTTSYYYTPSHQNLEHSADPKKERGIQPDLRIQLSTEDRQALRDRLARASPPPDCRAALDAWERESGASIVEPIPIDVQLQAALDLFAGKRPGPQTRTEAP